MQQQKKRNKSKQKPHPHSYAVTRHGLNNAQPQTAIAAAPVDVQVTDEGFTVNGATINLSRWIPDWEQMKNLHKQIDVNSYKKYILAAIATAQVQIAAAESKLCMKDPHNNGVSVVHLEDTAGPLASLPATISANLIDQAKCGALTAVTCTESLMNNVTILFDYMYHSPVWIKDCVEASMKNVGHFAITDGFDLEHIRCIWSDVHMSLSAISTTEKQKLVDEHSGSATGAVVGVLLTAAIVSSASAYMYYHHKKHGQFPFQEKLSNCFSMFRRQSNYQNIDADQHASGVSLVDESSRLSQNR